MLVSTGASKWREILKIKNSVKKRNIIFMHCVSAYPCDYKNINLPRMEYLRKLSKTVGYSGHLPDIEDAIAAMSLGAKYIEKHFTIDKKLPGRDNKFAILPSDLKKIHLFRNKFNMMSKFHGLDLQKKRLIFIKIIEEDGQKMKNNNDRFSVIIRTKNEERWIGHAIQSILSNIKKPEIIIVDNNSIDKTLDIVRMFKQDPLLENNKNNLNYTNINVYQINYYTPGKALNYGVKKCKNNNIIVMSAHCVLKKLIS